MGFNSRFKGLKKFLLVHVDLETMLQDMVDNIIKIWKMLWNGNECGKNKSNENLKTAMPSKNYDKPKTTRECGIF